MKQPNQNAKDPRWKAPVDLPGVKPGDYRADIPSSNGSASKKHQPRDE